MSAAGLGLRAAPAALLTLLLSACGGEPQKPEPPPTVMVPASPADGVMDPSVDPFANLPDEAPISAPSAGAAADDAAKSSQIPATGFACIPFAEYKAERRAAAKREAMIKSLQTAAAQPAPLPPAAEVKPQGPMKLGSILGRKVVGRDGEDMGRVVDVLADQTGRTRAAVIDFGGFLGVGNRRIAVEWSQLQIALDNDQPVVLAMDREQVQGAPEYKDAAHAELFAPRATAAPAGPPGE